MPDNPNPQTPDAAFAEAFGEPMADVLNMATWRDGADLAMLYARLQTEVAECVAQESAASPTRYANCFSPELRRAAMRLRRKARACIR